MNHSPDKPLEESGRGTALLVVSCVVRHQENEVLIEFTDDCRLFVNHVPEGVELSITGIKDD